MAGIESGSESSPTPPEAAGPNGSQAGRAAPAVVAGLVALAIAGLLASGRLGDWLFGFAALSVPSALILLGAPRRVKSARPALAALLAGATLCGGLLVLLLDRGSAPGLGLATVVGLMTLVPLVAVGVLFAVDFERFRPTGKSVEAIRSLVGDDDRRD